MITRRRPLAHVPVLVRALWAMARPLIVLSVLQVYAAGTLAAWALTGTLDAAALAWGLAALLPVTLAVHYANEYADADTDALTQPTPFSGGSGVLPRGDVPRSLARQAAWLSLVTGFIVALAGAAVGALSPAALALLVAGAVGGWQYSLPPLALAWNGWGELDNALLGGLVLPGYALAVQTGGVPDAALLAFVPFTGLAFLNLLATTWADRHADSQVGKRTLATRWPVARLRALYLGVALTSYAVLLSSGDWLLRVVPQPVVLASLAALPLTLWGAARYTRVDAPHASVLAMLVMLGGQLLAWAWWGWIA